MKKSARVSEKLVRQGLSGLQIATRLKMLASRCDSCHRSAWFSLIGYKIQTIEIPGVKSCVTSLHT